jgi:hypothetical protein
MGDWQRRLAALERAQIEQTIHEVAAECGLTPAELWAELDALEQHYAVHGEYPADVQQLHVFYARHGRWPATEADFKACLRAAGHGRAPVDAP